MPCTMTLSTRTRCARPKLSRTVLYMSCASAAASNRSSAVLHLPPSSIRWPFGRPINCRLRAISYSSQSLIAARCSRGLMRPRRNIRAAPPDCRVTFNRTRCPLSSSSSCSPRMLSNSSLAAISLVGRAPECARRALRDCLLDLAGAIAEGGRTSARMFSRQAPPSDGLLSASCPRCLLIGATRPSSSLPTSVIYSVAGGGNFTLASNSASGDLTLAQSRYPFIMTHCSFGQNTFCLAIHRLSSCLAGTAPALSLWIAVRLCKRVLAQFQRQSRSTSSSDESAQQNEKQPFQRMVLPNFGSGDRSHNFRERNTHRRYFDTISGNQPFEGLFEQRP